MRLELAPLGISVLTVMTGIVQTHFAQNVGILDLPSNSRYMAIRDIINHPPTIASSSGASTIEELAKSLMDDIVVNESGGIVWKGYKAGSAWLLSKLMPSFILV